MPLPITNRDARRLWLHANGLARAPTGRATVETMGAIVRDLGFVQLDSIQVVARAHHHILWSRNQNYREPLFDRMLGDARALFEHFTHDAAVLPMESYPVWQRQYARMAARLARSGWYDPPPAATLRRAIRTRIEAEGPLCSRHFKSPPPDRTRHAWMRPAHKLALDYMWYRGDLATSHREGFTKFYDLTERVIPAPLRDTIVDEAASLDALCHGALARLGTASPGDIQRFWDAADSAEVAAWTEKNAETLVAVTVETATGDWQPALAPADIEARLAATPAPAARLRILNPFDPAIRDRDRLSRLFGFDYRIEIFTPAAKRRYGYYVFPLLDSDRFVGRAEIRADRKAGTLSVLNLWPEPGLRWGQGRQERFEAELARLARFVGADRVIGPTSTAP